MVAAEVVRMILLLLHGLAGAAWFGSIFYNLFVLYPRATRFFDQAREREQFFLTLAQGVRWHMIAAMSLVGSSGLGLLALSAPDRAPGQWVLGVMKIILLIAGTVLFWRVSWTWWPQRLFALEAELPALQKRFRIGAAAMLLLVGLSMILGIYSRAW